MASNDDTNKINTPTSADAMLQAASNSLQHGYLTTEWWTTVTATALSATLALVGVSGSPAVQVASVLAPPVVAIVYAVARTVHKSALATAVINNLLRD